MPSFEPYDWSTLPSKPGLNSIINIPPVVGDGDVGIIVAGDVGIIVAGVVGEAATVAVVGEAATAAVVDARALGGIAMGLVVIDIDPLGSQRDVKKYYKRSAKRINAGSAEFFSSQMFSNGNAPTLPFRTVGI